MSVVDWSRLTGISADLIAKRLKAGWSVELALTAPLDTRGRKRKPKVKQPKDRLALPLPALVDYQRDMHTAHRRLSQSVRAFIREMEQQMADLRHGLDQLMAAQQADIYRGRVENFEESRPDRMSPSAPDSL
ncbi:hypothetical protein [Nitrobacter hamburgensis]|nr:hypothetical protein [Nitrobacter hamburgensis]